MHKTLLREYTPEPLRLRGSALILTYRLIFIPILFTIIRFAIRLPLTYLEVQQSSLANIYTIDTLIVLALVFFEIVITVYITVRWVNEYYIVYPNEIVLKKGFFFRKEKIFKCEHIQLFDLEQGLIAKLFDYGTLTLYSPALDGKIYIYNISRPMQRLEQIRSILTSDNVADSSGQSSNTVYLRQE